MLVGYARVSTEGQSLNRQIDMLVDYGVDKRNIYQEKISGTKMKREQLDKMIEELQEGDTVIITDLTRISRSTKDLLEIVELLQSKNVHLVSNKESLDTSTATGKLMLTMIGAINEFERVNLLERQKEGIAIAKAAGKYKGRKEVKIDSFEQYYQRYKNREFTKSGLAKELNISRPTLDKLISEYESK